MKKIFHALLLLFFVNEHMHAQGRDVNKLTLGTTYSYAEIHKSLRDLVDGSPKEKYFEDEFFNGMLRKVLTDKQFSEKEKVQVFYLMLKKVGYGFVGVEYLPPKQSYYAYHSGKIYILQKTKVSLRDLQYNAGPLLAMADTMKTKDAIISSSALLLAALLNSEQTMKKLAELSVPETIQGTKNPGIFNHFVCMSAGLVQDSAITRNLRRNLGAFSQEEMTEDVFCALYSRNNPVSSIREYVLKEKNMQNDLSIETALCALADKVPPASYQKSMKELIAASAKEKWKSDLLKKILANKIPFNYALTSKDQLVTKTWSQVVLSVYNDGVLISNGSLLEFDPN